MRALAFIPARGGSKRIPGKNLAEVGGVSLLVRALDAAAPCGMTVVSTDDNDIRSACGVYGVLSHSEREVSIHERQPEHATDTAQIEDAIDDCLRAIDRVGAETHGIGIDAIVLLQPTSPFRTAAHVAEALRILRETRCDSVVSVTRLHSLHPVFHGEVFQDGTYVTKGYGSRPRSQELDGLVYENGAIYAFTRRHWADTRSRMGGDMRALVMHWSEAVEIDTPEDLEAARRMARDEEDA